MRIFSRGSQQPGEPVWCRISFEGPAASEQAFHAAAAVGIELEGNKPENFADPADIGFDVQIPQQLPSELQLWVEPEYARYGSWWEGSGKNW